MSDDWEGGERQGVRWRRVGAAVVTLALVAGGVYLVRRERGIPIETGEGPAVVASESVDVVVVGPSQAGERWYCPDSHPVRVHADGLYYPDEYPRGYNLLERPQNCYLTPALAEADGFELADPPDDTVVAGGVYVEDNYSPSTAACQEMAYQAHFDIPCPTKLPTPAIGPSCSANSCMYGGRAGRFGQQEGDFSVIIEQRQFRTPDDWPAAQPQVIIAAAEITKFNGDGTATVRVHPELVTCNSTTHVGSARDVTVVECPPAQTWIPRIQGDPHEGHTAAFWRRGNAAYAVSVEGSGPQVRALVDVLVENIKYYRD